MCDYCSVYGTYLPGHYVLPSCSIAVIF